MGNNISVFCIICSIICMMYPYIYCSGEKMPYGPLKGTSLLYMYRTRQCSLTTMVGVHNGKLYNNMYLPIYGVFLSSTSTSNCTRGGHHLLQLALVVFFYANWPTYILLCTNTLVHLSKCSSDVHAMEVRAVSLSVMA